MCIGAILGIGIILIVFDYSRKILGFWSSQDVTDFDMANSEPFNNQYSNMTVGELEVEGKIIQKEHDDYWKMADEMDFDGSSGPEDENDEKFRY